MHTLRRSILQDLRARWCVHLDRRRKDLDRPIVRRVFRPRNYCGRSAVYLGTREGALFAAPQNWQAIPNTSGKAILSLSYPFLGSDGIYRLDDLNCHPFLGSIPEVTQVLQDSAGITYWRSSYFGISSSADGLHNHAVTVLDLPHSTKAPAADPGTSVNSPGQFC